MDSDLLRRACERANLRVYSVNASRPWMVEIPDWGGLHLQHPAVESYVVDVLVGMVRERGGMVGVDMETFLLEHYPDQILIEATPEQRITAALEVLSND